MSDRYPGGVISQTAPTPSGPYSTSTAPGVWTLEQAAYWQKQGNWPTAGNVDPSAYIENLFSTYLYTGTGSVQTINNGIDLAGKGGMVWTKTRSSTYNNALVDTARGGSYMLFSNTTGANYQLTPTYSAYSFNSNGYSNSGSPTDSLSGGTLASWTFRKQPKFFDIVTYTGNGVSTGRTISHNLGSAPGMIILKVTDLAGDDWYVYHRSIPTSVLGLNLTNGTSSPPTTPSTVFGNGTTTVAPTSTQFTIGGTANANGYTYVAYLFAHDAGGFGTSGTDNVISCGSFTTDSTGGYSVTLGYEPQYVMIKRTDGTGDWLLLDVMRGASVSANSSQKLRANTTAAEVTDYVLMSPKANGFYADSSLSNLTGSSTYIYMAIRRPMKVPTDATTVFSPVARTGNGSSNTTVTAGFPVDMLWNGIRNFAGEVPAYFDRLRGNDLILFSPTTTAEFSTASVEVQFNNSNANTGIILGVNNNGINGSGYLYVDHFFRRASGFFDEVCYTGTGSNTTITHNLGVAPELIIVKSRSSNPGANWMVWNQTLNPSTGYMYLNDTMAASTFSGVWNGAPTSTYFTLGTNYQNNNSGTTFVAYLFATCPGVSKVGSYTGTGATQTINCGFTGGARFVLIKRTDSTGDWYVWDTARGMVAGTDPSLSLNTTAAEVNANSVYTATTGFSLLASPSADVNASGGSYIFLAIA